MSRALALIRFTSTDNIYLGVYCGTVDVVYPFMLPYEKCMDLKTGQLDYFKYVLEFCKNNKAPNYESADVDNIEIYSDYGGGFFWEGVGVERFGYILPKYQNPWINTYPDPWTGNYDDCIVIADGIPEWAEQFIQKYFK